MSPKPKNTKQIKHILNVMHEMFRDFPMTELKYETPFQCLIAVMMSAQTTDVQVNKVTTTLFQKIKTPTDVVKMGQEKFGQSIKSIGLRTGKAKNIFAMSQQLIALSEKFAQEHTIEKKYAMKQHTGVDNHMSYESPSAIFSSFGYIIPDSLDELVALPGVGIKTAKVVLYVLYGHRHVAVDTHVHRVMNRLGVVSTKSPEQTSKQLETAIPDSYKDIAHKTIIYFGRYHCTAKNPKCLSCPLQKICPYFKEVMKEKLLGKNKYDE